MNKKTKKRMKFRIKKNSLLGKLIIVAILLIIVLNVLRYAAYFKKEDESRFIIMIQNNIDVELEHELYVDDNEVVYFSEDDMKKYFDSELYYEKDESNLRRYVSISQNKVLEITEEQNHMYINGTFTKIKGSVINRDGIYYFPISELADIYNLEVDYLPDNHRLNIEKLSEESTTAIVNRDLNLKYKMTSISKNIAKLSQGDKVTVVGDLDQKWIKVKTSDYKVGYVKKSKLIDIAKERNNLELAGQDFTNFDFNNDAVIEITNDDYENFEEQISTYEGRKNLIQELTSKISNEIASNSDIVSKNIGLEMNMVDIQNTENYYKFLKELKAYVNTNGCFLIVTNQAGLDKNVLNNIANVVI